MRLLACTALVLAACHPGSDDSFPIAPGGDDSPIVPAPDAPSIADASSDGATSISGRVCVVDDLRNLTSCTTGDASGITVALGTTTAVTAVDGTFTIAAPPASNLPWTVTASGFVPTVMPVSTVNLIPLVTDVRYADLLLSNGVVLQAGEGSIVARVVRSAGPAVGVLATVDPPSQFGPLYDGSSATMWDRDATGTAGVVWIPDSLEGGAMLTMVATDSTVVMVNVPTVAGAITFATVAFP